MKLTHSLTTVLIVLIAFFCISGSVRAEEYREETALSADEFLTPYATMNAFDAENFEINGMTIDKGWRFSLGYQGNWTTGNAEINVNCDGCFSAISFYAGCVQSETTATLTVQTYAENHDLISETEYKLRNDDSATATLISVSLAGVYKMRIACKIDGTTVNAPIFGISRFYASWTDSPKGRRVFTSNWRYNVEPLDRYNVNIDASQKLIGGVIFKDPLEFPCYYHGNWTTDLGQATFVFDKHYKKMSFDVGFNPGGWPKDAAVHVFTSLDGEKPVEITDPETGIHIPWNDTPHHIELDVSGVQYLILRINAGGLNSNCYTVGNLQFVSDGMITGVALEKTSITLTKENPISQIKAHVIAPDALNTTVTYSTDDPHEACITVADDGTVYARGNGTVNVTVSTADSPTPDGVPFTETCKVTVKDIKQLDAPVVSSFTISDTEQAEMRWKRVAGAEGYRIEYDTDKEFGNPREIIVKEEDCGTVLDNLVYSWSFPAGSDSKIGYARICAFYDLASFPCYGKLSKAVGYAFGYTGDRDGWPIPNQAYAFGSESYLLPVQAWTRTYATIQPAGFTYIGKMNHEVKNDKFGGMCFGLAASSAANYLKQINLNTMFPFNSGIGLVGYGYESLIQTSDGKEAYSLRGNDEAVELLERLMVSQASMELQKARLNWTGQDVLDYINDPSKKNPILITMETTGGDGHAVVLDPTKEPVMVDDTHWKIGVYDPNQPIVSSPLSNPTVDYSFRVELTISTSKLIPDWKYRGGTGDTVLAGPERILTHKYLNYYDLSKLSKSFYTEPLYILSVFPTAFFGSNITDISFSDNGNKALEIQGGEIKEMSGCDYTAIVGDAAAATVRMLPFTSDNISYTASSGPVLLMSNDGQDAFYVRHDGKAKVDYEDEKEALTIVAKEDTPVTISMLLDGKLNKKSELTFDLPADDQVTVYPTADGDTAIDASKAIKANISYLEDDKVIASADITLSDDQTTLIRTGEGSVTGITVERGTVTNKSKTAITSDKSGGGSPATILKADIAVGTVFTVSNAKYKILQDGKTVGWAGPIKKNIKSITIPSKVSIKGKAYDVTRIEAGSGQNLKKLKQVTIGKNIQVIGKKAFYRCSKLKKITFKGKRVKSIGKKAFKGIAKRATFKFPKNKKIKKKYNNMIKKAK